MALFARCASKTEEASRKNSVWSPKEKQGSLWKTCRGDSTSLALSASAPVETPWHA
jgi:hypothetical protein